MSEYGSELAPTTLAPPELPEPTVDLAPAPPDLDVADDLGTNEAGDQHETIELPEDEVTTPATSEPAPEARIEPEPEIKPAAEKPEPAEARPARRAPNSSYATGWGARPQETAIRVKEADTAVRSEVPTRHAPNSSYGVWGSPQPVPARQPEVQPAKAQVALAEREEVSALPEHYREAIERALKGELPDDGPGSGDSTPPEDTGSGPVSGGGQETSGQSISETAPAPAPAARYMITKPQVETRTTERRPDLEAEPDVMAEVADLPAEDQVEVEGKMYPCLDWDEKPADAAVRPGEATAPQATRSKLLPEEIQARNDRDADLINRWKNGTPEESERAAAELIGHYDQFLKQQADLVSRKAINQQDVEVLAQEGRLEFLSVAQETWDPERGASLITFAGNAAIHRMNEVALSEKRDVTLPLVVARMVQKINFQNRERAAQGLPVLTRQEIAEQFDLAPDSATDTRPITPGAVERANALGMTADQTRAWEPPFPQGYNRISEDNNPSVQTATDILTDFERVELRTALNQAMTAALSPEQNQEARLRHMREMAIVALHLDGLTFREIAEVMTELTGQPITHQRVQQIQRKGLKQVVDRMSEVPVLLEAREDQAVWVEQKKKKRGSFVVGEHIHPAGAIDVARKRWLTPDDEQGKEFDPLQRAWLGYELGLVAPREHAEQFFRDGHNRFHDLAEQQADPDHLRQAQLAMAYEPVLRERSRRGGRASFGTVSAVYNTMAAVLGVAGEDPPPIMADGQTWLVLKPSIFELLSYSQDLYASKQGPPDSPDLARQRRLVTLPNALNIGVETGAMKDLPTEKQKGPVARKMRAGLYEASIVLPATAKITLSGDEREFIKEVGHVVEFHINRYGQRQQPKPQPSEA